MIMKIIRNTIIVIIILSTFFSCKKDKDSIKAEGEIEFYLLKSFETIENSAEIIELTVITNTEALINYWEIESYNPNTYAFKISDEARNRFTDLEFSPDRLAFALKANEKIIYTGYFVPCYSSAICNWVVIDPTGIELNNKMSVRLGYPGLPDGTIIPDKRNNELFIAILKRDNKLIE